MAENFSVIKGSINACNSGLAKLGSHGVMGLDSGLVEVGYGALEGSSHGVKPNLGWDSSGVKDIYFGFCLDSEAGKLSTLISLANKALLNEASRFLGTSSDFVFPLGSRASSSPSPFGGGVLAKPLERRARASRSTVGKMDLLFDQPRWNPLRVVLADGKDVEMAGLSPNNEVATEEGFKEVESSERAPYTRIRKFTLIFYMYKLTHIYNLTYRSMTVQHSMW